jgi:hypothetical protein
MTFIERVALSLHPPGRRRMLDDDKVVVFRHITHNKRRCRRKPPRNPLVLCDS